MSLLTQVWDTAVGVARNIARAVLDTGWSVWHEVTDGARRRSWWLLVALVWLDGVLVAHWLL